MPLDILLPMIILPLAIVAGLTWYRRAIGRLEPDPVGRPITGSRLTSEALRRLPSPPWRVVYEIGAERLGGVDHVVLGPPGVIAVATVMADRPDGEVATDPSLVIATATTRGAVEDVTAPAGLGCDLLAKVFWGAPPDDGRPAVETGPGSVGVLGQHLGDWLTGLPGGVLDADQVDRAWQAVSTGIGRPDPLT